MGGISMLGGLISSNIAASQASKAANAARAEYNSKKAFLGDVFNRQYYQDITQRTDVQNMLRLMNENQERQAKRDEALSAITGGAAETALAAQDSRNKSYADALAEIASNASQLKDTYLQQYQNGMMSLTNPEYSILSNNADQMSQAGANLFQSGITLAAKGWDGLKK